MDAYCCLLILNLCLDFAQLIEMRVNEQEGDQVEYYFHFEGCKFDVDNDRREESCEISLHFQ